MPRRSWASGRGMSKRDLVSSLCFQHATFALGGTWKLCTWLDRGSHVVPCLVRPSWDIDRGDGVWPLQKSAKSRAQQGMITSLSTKQAQRGCGKPGGPGLHEQYIWESFYHEGGTPSWCSPLYSKFLKETTSAGDDNSMVEQFGMLESNFVLPV